jgi:hypothetical protein
MSVITIRRGLHRIAAVVLLAGCAVPGSQAGSPEPGAQAGTGILVPREGWRFSASEHLSLWYHGLSYVLPPLDTMALPIYHLAERERALAAARRAGVSRTPIEAAADSIAREFAGSSSYEQLQFLPLYFEDAAALFNAIRVWDQAQGNPQGAGSQQGAQAVALLSSMFETPRLRRWVVLFANTLQAERTAWYSAYWAQREPELRTLAQSAEREWRTLEAPLAPLFRYLQLTGGEALLTPSLGGEGRTVTERSFVRSAVGAPTGSTAGADVAFSLLHELMFSVVGEVVTENLAPARLRDLGQDAVTSVAAVRAGALALARLAPARADGYQRFYLRSAGRSGTGDAAFRAAFPLPAELESALPRAVEQALAGI